MTDKVGLIKISSKKTGLVLQLACFGVDGTEAEETLSIRFCAGALRRTRCVELLTCSRKSTDARIVYLLTYKCEQINTVCISSLIET